MFIWASDGVKLQSGCCCWVIEACSGPDGTNGVELGVKLGAVGLMLLLISMGGGMKKSQDVAGYAAAWPPVDGVKKAADELKVS